MAEFPVLLHRDAQQDSKRWVCLLQQSGCFRQSPDCTGFDLPGNPSAKAGEGRFVTVPVCAPGTLQLRITELAGLGLSLLA